MTYVTYMQALKENQLEAYLEKAREELLRNEHRQRKSYYDSLTQARGQEQTHAALLGEIDLTAYSLFSATKLHVSQEDGKPVVSMTSSKDSFPLVHTRLTSLGLIKDTLIEILEREAKTKNQPVGSNDRFIPITLRFTNDQEVTRLMALATSFQDHTKGKDLGAYGTALSTAAPLLELSKGVLPDSQSSPNSDLLYNYHTDSSLDLGQTRLPSGQLVRVFAAAQDLRFHNGKKISPQEAMSALTRLGADGLAVPSYALYSSLQNGSYQGQWIIPPIEVLTHIYYTSRKMPDLQKTLVTRSSGRLSDGDLLYASCTPHTPHDEIYVDTLEMITGGEIGYNISCPMNHRLCKLEVA
jgi:hypothetical protein